MDWNEGLNNFGDFAGYPITGELLNKLKEVDAAQAMEPGYYKSKMVEVSEGKLFLL